MSTTDMVVAQPLLPMDPDQAQDAMRRFQATTRAMLDTADWIGEPGADESFVKRSGWSKIATAYGLSTEILGERIDRDTNGKPMRAHAKVRATTGTGRFADGDGGCGIDEPRFRNPTGRQKIEHDLPATAVTRATNRAISNLVGFGQVSAEEVDADVRAGASAPALPAWAEYDSEEAGGPVIAAANQFVEIVRAAGADDKGVAPRARAIREFCGGGIPKAVVYAIGQIHDALGSAPAQQPREQWVGGNGGGE